MLRRAFLAFPLLFFSLHGQTQLPQFDAKTLSGQDLSLPATLRGHTAVLVLCFTHASGPRCTEWSKRLESEFKGNNTIDRYTAAFLQDVPWLVRGMAIHGIRSDVPKAQYSRFLIVKEHEKQMKTAVGFHNPDDAYVVVLGPDGAIRGTLHGPVSDGGIQKVLALLPK